jgi:hypothetical protein
MAATASVPAVPAPAGRSRWTRLIPVAIIVYIISFMDRTNIGFAFDGMGKDLHLDSAAKGLAGGIFFVGYLVMQIPGGHLAERWSAKKFVGIMILIWARHPGADQPLVPGPRAGPGLRVLDDEYRHLLDHHRAAVRLDPDLG